ncbi:MAG TPA: alpha/beta hydrolase-fold protein [Tepidisphaeraceae bacterium]|nr:alpha/beta hydrolase-fold protein [Tepidisphaeraceae bacterium]
MRHRKVIAALATLPVLGLVGGLGYYAVKNRQIEADLNAAVARAEASKPVQVDFAVSVPGDTPKDQIIYLSGSVPALGNWDAAGVPMQRQDDGKWHAKVTVLSGIDYGYKVTRGTWGTVETDAKGAAIADHSLNVEGPRAMDVSVAEWIDHGQAVPGRVTMTGDLRLTKNFPSKLLNNTRTLIVYLPPGYDQNTADRYPVLYMQDGQNLFDEATSFAGVEWKMDEAAQALIGQGEASPFIVVGIYNTPQRTGEFTPPTMADAAGSASDHTPAHGDLYARFVIEEVKPFIDQTYRTQTDRAHTLIGGAALGGLEALYTAQSHSDIFGQVIALSPWLRQNDKKLVPQFVGDGKWLHSERLYASMGTDPGDNGNNYPGGPTAAVADGAELAQALKSAGLQPDKDFVYREIKGGHQDEPSWQAEIGDVLKWVFARPATESTTTPAVE